MNNPGAIARKIVAFVFYGNYFYGLCAMALMLETVVQLGLNVRDPLLYGMGFLVTVLFYSYPYARNYQVGRVDPDVDPRRSIDSRAEWYRLHRRFTRVNRGVFSGVFALCVTVFVYRHLDRFQIIPVQTWMLTAIFPVVALLYYGSNYAARHYSLRQIGWAKPFVIGFVWTGLVYVYPILYAQWIMGQHVEINFFHLLQFFKSMMYISLLAILFDIKDYATDKTNRLHTLIVRMGIRRALFGFILPLCLLGLLMFFAYAFTHAFSPGRILLTMIPFLLLLLVVFSFRRRRPLLFYLIVIDGLMLAKAFFGILAVLI